MRLLRTEDNHGVTDVRTTNWVNHLAPILVASLVVCFVGLPVAVCWRT